MLTQPDAIDLLIVDDDPDFRGTVARRFLRRGFRVHEASDGEEALELAERRDFDVAILDMVMPGMSGLELLEKLKASRPSAKRSCSPARGRSRRPSRP